MFGKQPVDFRTQPSCFFPREQFECNLVSFAPDAHYTSLLLKIKQVLEVALEVKSKPQILAEESFRELFFHLNRPFKEFIISFELFEDYFKEIVSLLVLKSRDRFAQTCASAVDKFPLFFKTVDKFYLENLKAIQGKNYLADRQTETTSLNSVHSSQTNKSQSSLLAPATSAQSNWDQATQNFLSIVPFLSSFHLKNLVQPFVVGRNCVDLCRIVNAKLRHLAELLDQLDREIQRHHSDKGTLQHDDYDLSLLKLRSQKAVEQSNYLRQLLVSLVLFV